MIESLFLALSGAVLVALSAAVLISNPKKSVNRALAFFLLSGFCWLVSNLLTNISSNPEVSLWFARSTLIGAALLPLSFLVFVLTYVGYKKLTTYHFAILAAFPAFLILLTPSTLNIETIEANGENAVAGPLYFFLLPYLFLYFIAGFVILIRFYRRASSQQKSQLNYIFTGLFLTLLPAVITNGILPTIGEPGPSAYGPATVVIMSVFTTLAIVKHSLLDIRLVVARSLGYLLVLGTLGALFALASVTITSIFLDEGNQVSTSVKITYAVLALLLAISFQPLKRYFDKATKRIFYRDSYDSQELLNELNRSLVTTIDLEELLRKSGEVIRDTIKTEYCGFVIRESDTRALRLIGDHKLHQQEGGMHLLANAVAHFPHRIIVFDELDPSKKHLADLMRTNNVTVLVKLQGVSKGRNQNPGFILLGHKKSGSLYSSQDIQVLGIIADELVIAIQNSLRFEEIQQFNITLRKKIDDATRELRRVNARLRELDKTKDEFISMASHQLRTPLTAVKGYLSMILEGDTGPVKKDQREMIQRSFDGAQKMVYLIADMLNVSRLQTGKFVIENKPTDLSVVVQGEVDQLKEEIAQKKISLSFKKPDSFPTLDLDETKMRQVIMNFLDNALYYTPSGGSIEVRLEAGPESTSYTVTDTGVGVPKDVQHHLFSKFYRADNARKMRPDGTGLGLYMAKKVVTAQGGAIIFRSEEGKGSTFGFSFPRASTETKTK